MAEAVAEIACLAEMVYFEARGECPEGMWLVASTAVVRSEKSRYPDTLCGVVHDDKQYSYFWDGKPEIVEDRRSYGTSWLIAAITYLGWNREVSKGVTHFHSASSNPGWPHEVKFKVCGHTFYAGVE